MASTINCGGDICKTYGEIKSSPIFERIFLMVVSKVAKISLTTEDSGKIENIDGLTPLHREKILAYFAKSSDSNKTGKDKNLVKLAEYYYDKIAPKLRFDNIGRDDFRQSFMSSNFNEDLANSEGLLFELVKSLILDFICEKEPMSQHKAFGVTYMRTPDDNFWEVQEFQHSEYFLVKEWDSELVNLIDKKTGKLVLAECVSDLRILSSDHCIVRLENGEWNVVSLKDGKFVYSQNFVGEVHDKQMDKKRVLYGIRGTHEDAYRNQVYDLSALDGNEVPISYQEFRVIVPTSTFDY